MTGKKLCVLIIIVLAIVIFVRVGKEWLIALITGSPMPVGPFTVERPSEPQSTPSITPSLDTISGVWEVRDENSGNSSFITLRQENFEISAWLDSQNCADSLNLPPPDGQGFIEGQRAEISFRPGSSILKMSIILDSNLQAEAIITDYSSLPKRYLMRRVFDCFYEPDF